MGYGVCMVQHRLEHSVEILTQRRGVRTCVMFETLLVDMGGKYRSTFALVALREVQKAGVR